MVHLVYTISVLTLCPSTANLPSASWTAGFYSLTWSVWICVVTRSQLDPILFHQSISVAFIENPEQGFYSSHLETTHRESPERREKEMDPRGLCDSLRLVWESLTLGPHTSVANAGFHLLLEGEGRSNPWSRIWPDPFRLQRTVPLTFLTVVKYTGLLKLGG